MDVNFVDQKDVMLNIFNSSINDSFELKYLKQNQSLKIVFFDFNARPVPSEQRFIFILDDQ